ncbi:PAS domain S-box protein [Haloarcula sp. CBA1130]|uniref:PAS domain S-box protein n=1 Tax=unclassified Haloarcula TaxID=2624677 RepID=UPI00124898E1|nr:MULTISPECIES: PAS domain S-box protein [unclassified Haloarcula]KAA9398203.1 PAS domain S-box protein [Haloarcula sp. CBA1129]KAA9402110.1 PAS domain S-box protein [Haloarcula sp. CBA1130]
MSDTPHLLYVGPADDDADTAISDALGSVTTVTTAAGALSELADRAYDAVICEHDLPGAETGLDVLASIREQYDTLPVVLCTTEPDGVVAAHATRLNVTEYVPRSEGALTDRVYDIVTQRRVDPNSAADPGPTEEDDADPVTSETMLPPEVSDSFDAIAGSISDAVVTIDADSEVVYANDEVAELTGYDRAELVGDDFAKVIPEHLRDSHFEGVDRYRRTGDRNVDWDYLELPLVTATGDQLTVAVSFGDFERDGQWFCTGVLRDISDRKERERALEETNRRLDLALDGTNTGVYEWNLATDEMSWDEATADLFGTTPDAFAGTVSAFHEYVHPDDRPSLEGRFERVAESNEGLEAEFRAVVDGETRWLRTSGVVEDRDAQAPRLVAIVTDVTERKEREQTLHANNDSLQALTQLATGNELSETETVGRVIEIGLDRLDMAFGYLSRIDDGVHEIQMVTGNTPLESGTQTPLEDTYCQQVLESGDLYAITDATTEDGHAADVYRKSGVACYAGGLITVGGEPYGTLCFGDERPRSESFSESEEAFMKVLVEWVNHELERRHREDELQRYENIIEAVDDGVYALDSEGYFEFVNQAMTDLTGYSESELLGSYTGFIKNDGVVERAESIVQEMIFEDRDDEETFELEIQQASGNSFPAQDHMTLLYDDDGRFDGTAGVIRDITEQKQRDEALSGLLDTSRSLMQAQTAQEVAETVIQATESDLGFDHSLVRLYDAETDTLRPAAASDKVPERPVYDADEGFPGDAFQRGDPLVVDEFERVDNYDSDVLTAVMYLPMGDHGVVSIGAQRGHEFTESDVSVGKILASNAAAAFDRVERERSLLLYESVVENVRDMMYVLDDEGRFQLVTEPLAEWLGYERATLLGQHPRIVLDQNAIDEFACRIGDLCQQGGTGAVQLETALETASGEKRPAEIEVSLIDADQFRGTVGVVRDLTELKQARAELKDERDRFSYLFNTLPDAVIETETVADESVVRSVNPAFSDVFGYGQDTAVDSPLSDLLRLPDTTHDDLPRFDDRQANGDPFQTELRLMTETGFRDFLFRGVPYSRDGDSIRGFGIYTDITEQRERERRLKLLNRVLRHNLRNDLTVVLGMADALDERIDNEHHRSILHRLQRKAEEMASLSERARDMERSVRRDQFGTDPVNVPAAVRDIVSSYRDEHAGKIETDLPDTPVTAGDGRLHRVIGELLENSLEHGGDEPSVRIDVAADQRIVSITVADDGPGIPQHELDVVTGDEPITQLHHGTGLGLWLVVWVTETYGGTVDFGSGPDGGTVVTLELPRIDA